MDIGRITNGVVTVASGTIDVPKRVFNDPGATSDALKLAQRINDLLRNLWPLTPVRR
jgi:hypothetical protein